MNELEISNYNNAIPLLNEAKFYTGFAESVLLGLTPGIVFTDDNINPNIIYVCLEYGMSLLCSKSSIEMINILGNLKYESIISWLLNAFQSKKFHSTYEFLQSWPPLEWKAILHNKLVGIDTPFESITESFVFDDKIVLCNRVIYDFIKLPSSIKQTFIPKGFKIIPINKSNFSIPKETFKTRPENFWVDYKAWENNNCFGFIAITDNGNIASIAFSAIRFRNILEIAIETFSEYRGLGLAKIVCQHLILYCLNNNIIPIWTCRKGNIASEYLALSLGFEEVKFDFGLIPYYYLPLK